MCAVKFAVIDKNTSKFVEYKVQEAKNSYSPVNCKITREDGDFNELANISNYSARWEDVETLQMAGLDFVGIASTPSAFFTLNKPNATEEEKEQRVIYNHILIPIRYHMSNWCGTKEDIDHANRYLMNHSSTAMILVISDYLSSRKDIVTFIKEN